MHNIDGCNVKDAAMKYIVEAANLSKTLKTLHMCIFNNLTFIALNPDIKGKKYPFRFDLEVEY